MSKQIIKRNEKTINKRRVPLGLLTWEVLTLWATLKTLTPQGLRLLVHVFPSSVIGLHYKKKKEMRFHIPKRFEIVLKVKAYT